MVEALYYRDDIVLQSRCLKTSIIKIINTESNLQIKGWVGYCACVVETGLLELHGIGQANQNSIASMQSMLLLGGFGDMFSRKIFEIACSDSDRI